MDGHDGCHFYHQTYVEWGERMARLVNRDLYGTPYGDNIEAPDPVGASWLASDALEIEFGATGNGLATPGSPTRQSTPSASITCSRALKVISCCSSRELVMSDTFMFPRNCSSFPVWPHFHCAFPNASRNGDGASPGSFPTSCRGMRANSGSSSATVPHPWAQG